MGRCVDGKEHGEVLTRADDPERYDPGVFAAYRFAPPDDHRWGYCVDCRRPFRWSVSHQRWLPWPGGVASLPALTSEELEALGACVAKQQSVIACALGMSEAAGMRAELMRQASILQGLATAVAEAQYGLWEPEDRPPTPPLASSVVTASLPDLLTASEKRALDLTGELAGLFGRIVGEADSRPGDMHEVVAAIHVLQRYLLAQAGCRAYPGEYRLLGETLEVVAGALRE